MSRYEKYKFVEKMGHLKMQFVFWALMLLLIIVGRFLYTDELVKKKQYDYFTCNMWMNDFHNIEVKNGEIVQKFTAEQDGLYTFIFWIVNCSDQDQGIIRAQLKDLTGKIYYLNQFELNTLGEDEFSWMGGTTERLKKDKEYKLIITMENVISNASIKAVKSDNVLESLEGLSVNGNEEYGAALYFLQSFVDSYSVQNIWLILWAFSLCVGLICAVANRKSLRIILQICIEGWGIAASVLVIEILNESIGSITIKYLLINGVIVLAVYLLVFALLKNWAKYVTLILCTIIGAVNYYVKQFRGTELQITDIKSVSTAISVAGNYKLNIPWILYTVILIVLITIGLMVIMDHGWNTDKKAGLYKLRAGSAVCGVFILIVINSAYASKEMFDWSNLSANFAKYGWCFSNMIIQKGLQVQKPEGYSDENIKKIISEINENDSSSDIIPRNLIVIMNESFSDLGILGNLQTNQDYMPFIHNLEGNAIKGNLYVSTFGGNTAITEYEFLTGNTQHFLPQGTIPYLSLCQKEEEGLCRILQQQNYYTVAMHPYEPKNWNRDEVYTAMNFDEFLSLDDYENPEYLRNYVSDKADYNKIIEYVEKCEEDKNLFIFNVTMQNHGGYITDDSEMNNTITINNFESNVAETYLSLVYESDKAFEYLIDYFRKFEEPTMIVMFGDHMPSLPDNVYSSLYGENYQTMSLEERNKMYITPYIIWTNYDTDLTVKESISANYLGSYVLECAGLRMSDYNSFLCDLMDKVPVIGQYGFITREGQFVSYGEDEQVLSEYGILQYMRVKDRKSQYYNCFAISDN